MRADLDLDARFMREPGDGQAAGDTGIFREANIEVIAGAKLNEPARLVDGDEGFVGHDGDSALSAHALHSFDIIGGHRLLDH